MKKRLYYPWWRLDKDIKFMVKYLKKRKIKAIYGFPRGGLVIGVILSNHLNIPLYIDMRKLRKFNKNEVLLIDDISDSGKTFLSVKNVNDYMTGALFIKKSTKFMPSIHCNQCDDDIWVCFPWEPRLSMAERDGTLKNGKNDS